MPRVSALVKPSLLEWARATAGLSIEQVATKAKLRASVIASWERGDESPSLSQVRKLGEIYRRPLAVFFLPEPPQGFSAQREFRRLPEILPGNESPELLLALRWAVFRREAAMELHHLFRDTLAEVAIPIRPTNDPELAGTMIRESLLVTWKTQLSWPNAYAALSSWRSAMERLGVLVFQASKVPLDQMRGVCIPDQPLPVILLNSKDAPHGRIFSLLHEFAHILLHAGGYRTSRMVGARLPEDQPLEVAANAFAAAALLPKDEFLSTANDYKASFRGDDNALRLLAQRVKVSPEVVLRRLVGLGEASPTLYQRKRQEWGQKLWYVKSTGNAPVPVPVKIISSDGKGYARLVLNAYDQRLISTNTASDYLGAKPRHFPDIRNELATLTKGVGT